MPTRKLVLLFAALAVAGVTFGFLATWWRATPAAAPAAAGHADGSSGKP